MARFITHEGLGSGLLSVGFAATGSAAAAWAEQLLNTEDIIRLMVARMEADYDGASSKTRKAWTSRELD